MPEIPAPQREDVSPGDYALVKRGEEQKLYQYERPVDWEDLEWIPKQEFDEDEMPLIDFEQTRWYSEHNDSTSVVSTVYATSISSNGDRQSSGEDDASSNGHNRNGYWTNIDGTCIPTTGAHQHQYNNMVAVVNHLIEQHDLLDRIQLPYTPTWARTNCSINDVAKHPDGSDMDGAKELVSGDYLCTAHNKSDKKDRLTNLANCVDVETTYRGEWK